MKVKKILAVILCLAVVAGVMAAVAMTTANAVVEPEPMNAIAATLPPPPQTPPPGTTTATTTAETTTRPPGGQLLEWWSNILPTFTSVYNAGFDFISRLLTNGVIILVRLVFGPIM